jgi:hypothetical protein
MATYKIVVFQPYPFRTGQKIRIDGGPRGGDWQVVGVGERKVKLRCPVSQREFEWDRFCYLVEERQGVQWPQEK